MVASFKWEDTHALPEPVNTGKVTKSTVDDLQAIMPIYYVQVYVTQPDHLRELEAMGVHYDATPLFDSEQTTDTEYVEEFTGSDTDGGFYVYTLMPVQVYNGIRNAALNGEPTYKAVQLRQAPTEALNADGSVSWAYLANNLLAWAPPTTHITDSGETALDPTMAGDPVSGVTAEHNTLTLTCPTGQSVVGVAFASYGTPTGTYPDFAVSTCDAATSYSVVSNACVGQTSCSIFADNSVFGDPCYGTVKQLAVALDCEGPDKRWGRWLRHFVRAIRDSIVTVVNTVRSDIGSLVTDVLPTSDLTIALHVQSPGSTYTLQTHRAWGDSTRFGQELPLSRTRLNTSQFGGISLYPRILDDNGVTTVTVRRDRKTKTCVEGDSAAAHFEVGFLRSPRHCWTFTPSSATPAPYDFSTADQDVYQMAQFIDARKFATEALGYTPKKATVQTGKLAQWLAPGGVSYTPCLAARNAPNSMVNAYVDGVTAAADSTLAALQAAGSPIPPGTGSLLANAIEFAVSTDIVLHPNDASSRLVASHEYGHFFLCDLLASQSMSAYNAIWSSVISDTLPQQKSTEVIQLNEAFADWFASQVVGGTSYFGTNGSTKAESAAYLYLASAAPDWQTGMEANVGHPAGPQFSAAKAQGVARFATLWHDAIDGNSTQQQSQLTGDTYVWGGSPLAPAYSTWSDYGDDSVQINATVVRDALTRWANNNPVLSGNSMFSALSTELRNLHYSDAAICQLYSLHNTDGCPPAWDGNNPKTLTVSKTGNGSGTITATNPLTGKSGINCGSDCTETLSNGTSITLTATAAQGTVFTGWSGACTGNSTSCTVSMTAAQSVTATFTLAQYAITVTKTGNGSGTVTGTGISCGSDCSEIYNYGTTVTLTATPSSNSTFAGWSGGVCSGTASTCTVSVNAAKSVTATFNLKQFTLSVAIQDMYSNGINVTKGSVTGGGINCPGTCSVKVNIGTSVTLKNPNTANIVESWGTTGTSGCNQYDNTCTFTMTGNRSMTVSFATVL